MSEWRQGGREATGAEGSSWVRQAGGPSGSPQPQPKEHLVSGEKECWGQKAGTVGIAAVPGAVSRLEPLPQGGKNQNSG